MDTAPPLASLVSQNPQAFEWLVNRTQRIVAGLGQSIGLRGADLEDACAEVYLAVYRALPGFAGRSELTTWVYTIAARTLRAHRRKWKRGSARSLEGYSQSDLALPATPDELADAEENRRLWQLVAELDPRASIAIDLHYRRGQTIEQIATILDCPPGTVKTILFRARAELRARLQPLGVET